MVKVVELAVVVVAAGRAGEEEGAAEELALDGAGAPARLQAVGLKKRRGKTCFTVTAIFRFSFRELRDQIQ